MLIHESSGNVFCAAPPAVTARASCISNLESHCQGLWEDFIDSS